MVPFYPRDGNQGGEERVEGRFKKIYGRSKVNKEKQKQPMRDRENRE